MRATTGFWATAAPVKALGFAEVTEAIATEEAAGVVVAA